MTTVDGLPAHVLLVHVVVVLVPATALLLLLVAFWPAARRRLVFLTAAVAVITLVSVPLTTDAGEWLEHRLPSSPLIHTHTELGDSMLPWAIGLAVVALAFATREVVGHRTGRARVASEQGGPGAAIATHSRAESRPGGIAVTAILMVLTVVVAVGSVVTVYEIGQSGAEAAWTGKFSPTPLPRAGRPPGPDE